MSDSPTLHAPEHASPAHPSPAQGQALQDRARSTALRDAAQHLRERGADAGPDRAAPDRPAKPSKPQERPVPRPRRGKSRRNGDGGNAAAEEALALLADAQAALSAARGEIDRLRAELDEANARLMEENQESALMRRQRDGLQYRTDYLEEKLELATKALTRARRPWWRRMGG